MTYQRESEILRDKFTDTIRNLLNQHWGFIAGGAVTSVFSSTRINDFDIFFPSREKLEAAMASVPRDEKTIETDSALSIVDEGRRVQLIKVVTGNVHQIIESFDFTICQAAYRFPEGFIFGPEFLQHLAQKRLVFNVHAEYPICSLYRLRKFINRGFHFSGIDAIKLGLRIQALKVETLEDLRKQLMGIDTLFLKDLTDSLAGQGEKRYDFNEFLSTLEIFLGRLDELTGVRDE